jgi:transcriptional regulator with XRE-family HTH domain
MEQQTRRDELANFLRARRARLVPAAVEASGKRRRRTSGLTREEVAAAADISTAWYTWLEQGRRIRVSAAALTRIADALALDDGERAHLFQLAEQTPRRRSRSEDVSIELQQMLRGMGTNAVYLTNHCWDVLAWSDAAARGLIDYGALPELSRNVIYDFFTTPERREQVVDWERHAHRFIAEFRASYGRHKDDPRFGPLIERCCESTEFEQWWNEHQVHERMPGVVELEHPALGRVRYTYTTFAPNAGGSVRMTVYAPADDRTLEALLRS